MVETARPIGKLYGKENNLATMTLHGLHQILPPARLMVLPGGTSTWPLAGSKVFV